VGAGSFAFSLAALSDGNSLADLTMSMKSFAPVQKSGTPARGAEAKRSFFQTQSEPAFFTPSIQRKFEVSQPGDPHEKEAERMADHVVSELSTPFFMPAAPSIPSRTATLPSAAPAISRLPAAPSSATAMEKLEEHPAKEEEQLDSPLLRMADPWLSNDTGDDGEPSTSLPIQRKASGSRHCPGDASRNAGSILRAPCRVSTHLSGASFRTGSMARRPIRSSPDLARGPPAGGENFTGPLRQSKGSGQPLPDLARSEMESAFGANFKNVRVHTDDRARQLANGAGAVAFAHERDIYFNRGQFQPETRAGKHLLAHELTHVVQQGHASTAAHSSPAISRSIQRPSAPSLSRAPPSIQCLGWSDIKNRVNSLAQQIPGYTLMTVLVGYNPILGQNVAWTASNFFRGAAGLIPFGTAIFDKLNEGGVIDSVFGWIGSQINNYNLRLSRVTSLFSEAWEKMDFLRLDPIAYNVGVVRSTFSGFFSDVASFAGAVIDKLIEVFKELAIKAVRALIGDKGPAYDLICQVLGEDPLTGEAKEWNTVDFLRAVLRLFGFENHLAKMEETGTIEKAAAWIDEQVGLLVSAFSGLISGVIDLWTSLSLETLVRPVQLLTNTFNVVATFVGKLVQFAANVASKVLELIKEALIALLKPHVNSIPGYTLFTVCLGKDPITGEEVPRTAGNFVKGFLEFVPQGDDIYKNLVEGNALGKAMTWLIEQVNELGLSPPAIVQRFVDLWNSFSIDDLMNPLGAFERVGAAFLDFVGAVLTLAGRIAFKILEILFETVMGSGGAQVLELLKKGGDTFKTIVEDPMGFIGNLIGAVKQGVNQFAGNIWEHLKTGLMGWLFGALQGAGIQPPQSFDLKGILTFALEVFGLTYARIRPKLVKHLGERAVGYLESAFEVIRIIATEGLGGIWQKVVEFISGSLPEMILGAIREWVVEKIVTAAVTKLVSMFNPAGAVIQAILAIYNTVMFFIERIQQILALAESVINSLSKIAAGQIADAANFVEQTMARTLPVIISFLARLIGLGSISEKIKSIVMKLQAKVDTAVDKVIGWVVKQAKKLFGKGEGPATEQSEEVKGKAKTRLKQLIPGNSDMATIQQKIGQVAQELQPEGLKSLGIRTGADGQQFIYAEASPMDDLFKITAPGLVGNVTGGDIPGRAVRLGAQIALAPAPAGGQGANQLQAIATTQTIKKTGVTVEKFHAAFLNTRGLLVQEQGGATLYAPNSPPLSASERRQLDREIVNLNQKGANFTLFGGFATEGGKDDQGNDLLMVRTWNTGGNTRQHCNNNFSHAEVQFTNWYGQQQPQWRQRVQSVDLQLQSLSPCSLCAQTLASFVQQEKAHNPALQARITWGEAYEKATPTDGPACYSNASVQGDLAGWNKAEGPAPAGSETADPEATPEPEEQVAVLAPPKKDRFGSSNDVFEREADQMADRVGRPDVSKVEPRFSKLSVQRAAFFNHSDHSEAGPSAGTLAKMAGKGNPLNREARQDVEPHFGTSFSDVRVHQNSEAAALCQRYNARAFTHGSDIYFNSGEYHPHTRPGQHLLAHELTHVAQQRGSRPTPAIQRQTNDPGAAVSAPAAPAAPQKVFTVPSGPYQGTELDITAPSNKKLLIKSARLSLPKFKQRNSALCESHRSAFGGLMPLRKGPRGTTKQVENWTADVEGNIINRLQPLIQKARQSPSMSPSGETYYFALKKGQPDAIVFGSEETLPKVLALPFWDRKGQLTKFQVDHVVEDQLQGEDHPSNYELLEASANASAGSVLAHEISGNISGARDALIAAWPELVADKIPKIAGPARIKTHYDVAFAESPKFTLKTSGDGNRYWSRNDFATGQPLHLLRPLTAKELSKLQGAALQAVFLGSEGGVRRDLPPKEKLPFRLFGQNVQRLRLIDYDFAAGTMNVEAFKKTGEQLIYNDQPVQQWNLNPIEGLTAKALDKGSVHSGIRNSLRLPGLSPIRLDQVDLVEGRGLVGFGKVLPTVPLIKEADIDIILDGDDVLIQKTFDVSEIKIPRPFRLDAASLSIFYSMKKGLGITGEAAFGIERVGNGVIRGRASKEGGFELEGSFDFDPELFTRARVAVQYRDQKWSVEGNIGIDKGKIPGIASADIAVSYQNEIFSARGDADLDVPGLERGSLAVVIGPDQFSLGGEFQLSSEIPGIKSGKVSATVNRPPGSEEYQLTAAGDAVPDLPGVDAAIRVSYENGALTIWGKVGYERDLLSGEIEIGATNRAIGDDGQPSGEPSGKFTFYGGGQLTITIAPPWLQGLVAVKFLPNGEMEVGGEIRVKESLPVFDRLELPKKDLFKLRFDFPIFGIPVGPKTIGLKAFIKGGLYSAAGIGPGELEGLRLGIKDYNPDHPENTRIYGGGKFVVKADATLSLEVSAGIGLDVLIGGVEGEIGVEAGAGLHARAEAGAKIDWRPGHGFELDGNLSAEISPRFFFTVFGKLTAWFAVWDKVWRWNLKEYEYGPAFKLGFFMPLKYVQGQKFNPSLKDIKFTYPDLKGDQGFFKNLFSGVRNQRGETASQAISDGFIRSFEQLMARDPVKGRSFIEQIALQDTEMGKAARKFLRGWDRTKGLPGSNSK
jgi:hypothetical protein